VRVARGEGAAAAGREVDREVVEEREDMHHLVRGRVRVRVGVGVGLGLGVRGWGWG
jgi:hypothetical protein